MNRRTIRLSLVAAVAAGALTLGAAAPASAATPTGTIVDVAVAASGGGAPDTNSTDYDILVQALLATDLAPVLADTSTQFTVFAPNDQGFKKLVQDLTGSYPRSEQAALDAILATFTVEQISNILLYHVVPGEKLGPVGVVSAGTLTMANGGTVKPRLLVLQDENRAFSNPILVPSGINIQASNGVIHTTGRVLVPGVL